MLSFLDETGAFEEECVIRTSECNNGTFIELEPYDNPTCKHDVPDSCIVDGVNIFHDTTETFYAAGKYVGGSWECDSIKRKCFDGELN